MYYRRKIMLGLLQMFDGSLGKIDLQKLLFIATRFQEKPAFDFVPYKRGCFSFQSYADMGTMQKYGLVKEGRTDWNLSTTVDYFGELKEKDKAILREVHRTFEGYSSDDLIRYTYRNYPYYAINSEVVGQYMTEEEKEVIDRERPVENEQHFYSIGYEGISQETYLNKLIINNVRLLCDVRKNPLSMKYGFSKNQLKKACENVGVTYMHIPELGIDSDKRRNLNTQKDYDILFKEYTKTTLKENKESLIQLQDLLKKHNRVAVTCFEAQHIQCHRGKVCESLNKLPNWDIQITHL